MAGAEDAGLSRLLRPTVASRNSQLQAMREAISKERSATIAYSSQKSALGDSMKLTPRHLRSNTTMSSPSNALKQTGFPLPSIDITLRDQDEISDLTEDDAQGDRYTRYAGLGISRNTINHRKLLDELRIKVHSTEQLLQTPTNVKALNAVGKKHNQLMNELKSKYLNLGFFRSS